MCVLSDHRQKGKADKQAGHWQGFADHGGCLLLSSVGGAGEASGDSRFAGKVFAAIPAQPATAHQCQIEMLIDADQRRIGSIVGRERGCWDMADFKSVHGGRLPLLIG
jgi:hypothetical protein